MVNAPNPNHWTHQGRLARSRARALCLLWRRNSAKRRKVVKSVKCLSGGKKKKSTCRWTRRGVQRKNRGLTQGRFFWVSFGQSPYLSGIESTCDLAQGPPLCARASFSQDGFQSEGLREIDRTRYSATPTPFSDPWETFLHTCRVGGLLGLKDENHVVSLSFIQAGLGSSLPQPLTLSWSICP